MAQRLTASRYGHNKPKPPRQWVWMAAQDYDGLLLPDVTDPTEAAQLRPFLGDITEVYTTSVGMIALFATPIYLDPAELGALLPLRKMAPGGWTSFPDASKLARDTLACFLNGQNHVIWRKDWRAVDPLVFWDLEDVVLSRTGTLPTKLDVVSEAPTTVKTNQILQSVFEGASILREQRDRIAGIKDTQTSSASDTLRRFGMLIFRTALAGLCLYVAVLLFRLVMTLLAAPSTQEQNWFWVTLFFCGLVYFLLSILPSLPRPDGRVFRPRQSAGQQGGDASQGRSAAQLRSKYPGLFSRLNGWLVWNTLIGDKLRRGLEARQSEMERLLKQGKIDEALKRAMSVADRQPVKKSSLATRLPNIRSNLGLNFDQKFEGGTIPMGESAYHEMRQMYNELAEECQSKNDYARAAFIYDELLGKHDAAVKVLEEAKQYEDAAKLAVARNLSGGVIVRLWYLAGERDIAIALAERHSCFDTLIQLAESKSKEAGHFIRTIWAERLVAVGDVPKALLVSDPLPGFDTVRLRWLALAIGQGEIENPEIFYRALLVLPWRADVLNGAEVGDPLTIGGALEARIAEMIDPSKPPEDRVALLDHLVTAVSKKDSLKDRFRQPHNALLCEWLIRQVIADGVPLTPKTLQGYIHLARAAGRDLLAVDLRHIRRGKPKAPASETVAPLPAVSPTQPKWHHVVCLPHRRVLLGDDTGILRIMQPNGKVEWSDHVTDLAGFVRIRTGLFVLLILGQDVEKARRIVMLNTRTRKYTQIGRLHLEAWHSESNEHLWLIKSGQRIQALAVEAMFQDVPELRESWGITIKEEVIVLGFVHNDHTMGWYLQRCEGPSRFGLIEYWAATTMTLHLSAYILEPPDQTERQRTNIYTEPTAIRGVVYAISGENAGLQIPGYLRHYSWDYEQEIKSAHYRFFKSLDAPAQVRSYAMGPLVTENTAAIISRVRLTRQGFETLVCLENCRWVASDAAPDGRTWAVIDSGHRVILIDPVTHDIQIEA